MIFNSDVVFKSGVLEICISDYFVVYLFFNLKFLKLLLKFVCVRFYRYYNFVVFNEDLLLV